MKADGIPYMRIILKVTTLCCCGERADSVFLLPTQTAQNVSFMPPPFRPLLFIACVCL